MSNEPQDRAYKEPGRAGPDSAQPIWLSDADMADVAGRVAGITRSALPLESGLRALSEEVPSRKLQRVLREISGRLEAGESLERVFQQDAGSVPLSLRAVFEAGARTGNLAPLLERYLRFTRTAVELRRRAWMAMAYPLVLLLVAVLIVTFFLVYIVPRFRSIFEGFGVDLPGMTRVLLEVSWLVTNYGLVILAVGAGLICACVTMPGLILGRPAARRLVCRVPLMGTLLRYGSLAGFCHLLATLVESGVALPDALRIAGGGVHDAELEAGAAKLADRVRQGTSLAEAAVERQEFPSDLLQVFLWEREQDSFAHGLHAAGEMYEARASLHAGMVSVVWEPVFVIGAALTVGSMVIALFMPLIKLLNDLS